LRRAACQHGVFLFELLQFHPPYGFTANVAGFSFLHHPQGQQQQLTDSPAGYPEITVLKAVTGPVTFNRGSMCLMLRFYPYP